MYFSRLISRLTGFTFLLRFLMKNFAQSAIQAVLLAATCSGLFAVTTAHISNVARSIEGSPVIGLRRLMAPETIKAGDQPCLRFNAHVGVNPVATLTKPAEGSLQIFECAARTGSGKTVDAKNADAMENLVVLRDKAFCDYGKQWDKKFRDFRKMNAPLAAVVEDLMSSVGLIEQKEYKGTLFADEYAKGTPMVMTVDTVQYLRGLQAYFIKHNIAPRNPKPWLVLEVLKNPEAVTQADIDFWSGLFEIKLRSEDGLYQFLNDERKLRYDIVGIGSKGDYICHTPAEMVLLSLEKATGDLKTQKILMSALAGATGLVVYDLICPKGVIKDYIKGMDSEIKENIKTAAKFTAAAAVVYAAYRLYANAMSNREDAQIDEQEASENDSVEAGQS
jgi:hypothetical protein